MSTTLELQLPPNAKYAVTDPGSGVQPAATAVVREALPEDLEALLRLEQRCFAVDRLSRRSFRRFLRRDECVFLVACDASDTVLGYLLVILRRGTRLARLYSLAVDPDARGRGLAAELIRQAERRARDAGALYMRLEVATDNPAGIALYHKAGYRRFGLYRDYYEDHGDALRMEKCIHSYEPGGGSRVIPWVPQSTPFTCGPASLMMAMAALDPAYVPDEVEEIQIWREATTIFMTSGHGGSHPVGLALSAVRRGFKAEVWVNQRGTLFLDSVRDAGKKRVMTLVHQAFVSEARERGLPIHYAGLDQRQLIEDFNSGANVLVLISTYRMDRKKAPHWVVLSGSDDRCLFVQDPGIEDEVASGVPSDAQSALDYQHLPIAREEFESMSRFGGNRLQSAVILRNARTGRAKAGSGRRRMPPDGENP